MQFVWQHRGAPVSMKHFLTTHGISMRLIKAVKHGEGHFLVNDHSVTGVITVSDGDVAGLQLANEAPDPAIAVNNAPLAVIFEDDNWLVVNKPAGLTSVPGPSDREATLVNRIKGYLIAQQAPNQRPHLITRLDRDTSGLVLVAKHRVAQSILADPQLKATLHKTYLAWIQGTIQPAKGVIDQPIGRPDESPRRQIMATGKHAVTKYEVVATDAIADVSCVRLELVTGRTHQIRVHLTSLGHPLLGDALYGGNQQLIQRQALHAATLSFYDPFEQTQVYFEAPLPDDLSQLPV